MSENSGPARNHPCRGAAPGAVGKICWLSRGASYPRSQNLLLDESFKPKLCDFGLSGRHRAGFLGTPFWAAPEVLRGADPSPASDVYSFGILMFELLSRQEPFLGQCIDSVLPEARTPMILNLCVSARVPQPSRRLLTHELSFR